ncbi:hypothetical protein MNBD_GAMMA04-1023, partial [hydrothermal vent metagenome]
PTNYRINLTGKECSVLEQLVRTQTTPQNKVRRAKIILLANEECMNNKQIAEKLSIDSSDVTVWTKRWIERAGDEIEERVSDLPRSGAPSRITPEQWCQIMALACEPPENYQLPITHWSHKELAREVVKQGIVETISATHLGDFLKKQTYSHTAVAIG